MRVGRTHVEAARSLGSPVDSSANQPAALGMKARGGISTAQLKLSPSEVNPRYPRESAAKESQIQKASLIIQTGLHNLSRRRPTLPHTFACSTIGPAGLNFRVRDGNGCFPRGKVTDNWSRQLSAVSHQQLGAAPTFRADARQT